MSQGKQLTCEQKQAIVDVKRYMDAEKTQGKTVSTQEPARRTAQALNLRISTVKQVLAEVQKHQGRLVDCEPKPRGHAFPIVSDHEIAIVRRRIQDAALRGEMVTLPKLRHWLEQRQIDSPYSALRRALHRAGFIYGKASRRSALKEREEVIATRRRYLAAIRANRDAQGRTRRPEVYLDETFVTVNHRKPLTWHVSGALVNVPAGVGERLIIVDAIIQDDVAEQYGWVPKAHLHFKANRRTGDYQGSMNAENFSKWMRDQLLPHIPPHALIIFDNAPYHNLLTEDTFPQPHHKKAALQRWLRAHDIPYDAWLLKPALYALCRDHAPAPQYAIDELARRQGCDILRTPPDHPELQPIEQGWGLVKSKLADSQDGHYTMASLQERLEPAFGSLTAETCRNIFAHVRKEEERYWEVDEQLDDIVSSG
jgi:transposase